MRKPHQTFSSASRQLPAFTVLLVGMAALGVVVGAVFPVFTVLLGVPSASVLTPLFWSACFGAGVALAGANWLLASVVVGRRLSQLGDRLTTVAERLNDSRDGWTSGTALDQSIPVLTRDDLGRTAAAFNNLLGALEREHRFRSLIQATSEIFVLVDASGRITFASPSLTTVLGWPARSVLGRPLIDCVHPEDVPVVRALLNGTPAVGLRVLTRQRRWRRLDISAVDRRGDGDVDTVVMSARDVTERHDLQTRLSHQALHDPLTGLPNREHLLQAAHALAPLSDQDPPLAAVMIDLDRFKEINDTLGHSWGDRLLAQVGPRLRERVREHDVVARLGGDEFALLMPGLDLQDARIAAQRVLTAFSEAFMVEGMALDVGASLGVAVLHFEHTGDAHQDITANTRGASPAVGVPDGDHDATSTSTSTDGQDREGGVGGLLRRADIAMYAAKELGSGVEVYSPGSDRHDRSRLVLLSQLRRAIAEGQLQLHYQPQVSTLDGALVGVEALVRWSHPERGLLMPADFIPLVETSGLAIQLTDAVLDLALRQVSLWAHGGLCITVSVNITARCMQDPLLPERVQSLLHQHSVRPEQLVLELTETALLAQADTAADIAHRLRALGVRLALDDFGTGYSSMTHLRSIPVDELKIDRSFVAGMLDSEEDGVLVASLVRLAQQMGVHVVAEGVETQAQLEALRTLACDTAQGYHVQRPLPPDQVLGWVAALNPTAWASTSAPSA